MKQIIPILLLLLFNTTVSEGQSVEINLLAAKNAGHVVVRPSAEYQINMDGYEVPDAADLIIFHVLSSPKSHYYYQQLKANKETYSMTASALKASKGSPPFNGLTGDDGAFLIVGSETEPGSINMGILYSFDSISIIVRD